eukprot:scaffold2911_cov414-Prasinococcus_capsulatus_cf.AAC.13
MASESEGAAAPRGPPPPPCYLVVHNVAKKHNIGTLLRSACAFGVAEVILVGSNTFNTFGAHGSDGYGRSRRPSRGRRAGAAKPAGARRTCARSGPAALPHPGGGQALSPRAAGLRAGGRRDHAHRQAGSPQALPRPRRLPDGQRGAPRRPRTLAAQSEPRRGR